MIHCALKEWSLESKRVLVRADLNVPLDQEIILDDFRLRAVQPTIDYILEKNACIVLMTHIGRPQEPTPALSTYLLMAWFLKEKYPITWAANTQEASRILKEKSGIILLENLRFFAGEKNRSLHFAQELAQLGDYFVNDAFGCLHKNDTSITLVADFFPIHKKSIGFLVEKELKELTPLTRIKGTFILGGAKIKDKIPYIKGLMNNAHTCMLCPALVFTFLKAIKKSVGDSLVDDSLMEMCQDIITLSHQKKVELLFPLDYQIRQSSTGTLLYHEKDSIPSHTQGISIGPKTIAYWTPLIRQSAFTLFNGAIGFAQLTQTQMGMRGLLDAMTNNLGISIVTGGDSVSVANHYYTNNAFNFLSTGGGATLHFLSGAPLPGLRALSKNGAKT